MKARQQRWPRTMMVDETAERAVKPPPKPRKRRRPRKKVKANVG
jgi:hypothetical protein